MSFLIYRILYNTETISQLAAARFASEVRSSLLSGAACAAMTSWAGTVDEISFHSEGTCWYSGSWKTSAKLTVRWKFLTGRSAKDRNKHFVRKFIWYQRNCLSSWAVKEDLVSVKNHDTKLTFTTVRLPGECIRW